MTDFVSLKDMGRARENAEPKKRPKIVSLGYDCCMRTILTKLKYKPSKKEGELSMPFDLTIHPYETMCEFIQTDFRDYFEDITWKSHYCEIRKKEVKNMVNGKGVFFVHESHLQNQESTPAFDSDAWSAKPIDVDFHGNNKAMLKQRYFQRIANFYKILGDTDEVVFVLSSHIDIDVTILNNIIKEKFPDLHFKIYCLRIYAKEEKHQAFNKFVLNNMIINSIKLPTDGFWNTNDMNRDAVESILKEDLRFCCEE